VGTHSAEDEATHHHHHGGDDHHHWRAYRCWGNAAAQALAAVARM